MRWRRCSNVPASPSTTSTTGRSTRPSPRRCSRCSPHCKMRIIAASSASIRRSAPSRSTVSTSPAAASASAIRWVRAARAACCISCMCYGSATAAAASRACASAAVRAVRCCWKERFETMNGDTSYKHWRVETDARRIVWLALDKMDAGANVLSREVLEELQRIVDALAIDRPQGLMIYSGKANGFIAGADVKEFTVLKNYDEAAELIHRGQSIMDALEQLPFPTVAMIHGFCLGGGLELALACRYRVAEDDPRTRLGLPEVKLGIHPGFGGTVRLPPLVGAPAAMDLILTGRAVEARAAQRLGRAAETMVIEHPRPRRPSFLQRMTNHSLVRPMLASNMRKKVAEKALPQHYPAPYAVIDLWAEYMGDRVRMMQEEARAVARLVTGDTSRNLVRVFFLQERLKSLGRGGDFTPRRVHVIGAGVMGGDIAAWCALRGLQVTVQDRNPEALGRVMKRAYGLYKKKLKQPRLVQAAMDRLLPDVHGAGAPRADVVIEAIFEDVKAKQGLYREIEPVIRPDALLATNTSSIPLGPRQREAQ